MRQRLDLIPLCEVELYLFLGRMIVDDFAEAGDQHVVTHIYMWREPWGGDYAPCGLTSDPDAL